MTGRSTSVTRVEHAESAEIGDLAAEDPSAQQPRRRSPMAWLLTALVDLYRLTGPMRQPRCRFYPSCSSYARQALGTHGAVRGLYLTIRRLLRCHPWNPGGVDHVPSRPARPARFPRSPKA